MHPVKVVLFYIFLSLVSVCQLSNAQDIRWIFRYGGEGISLNYSVIKEGLFNNLYASANLSNRLTIFNLTLDGDSIWKYQCTGISSVWSLDRDNRNYVYAAGRKENHIFTVMCIDPCGSFKWEYNLGNASFYDDRSLVLCGSHDRIYAVGNRYNLPSTWRMIIVCFDSLGNVLWKDSLLRPPANTLIRGFIYGVEEDKNIYIGGQRYLLSYRTNGSLRWTYDVGSYTSLITGINHSIYGAGYRWNPDTNSTYEDLYVVKLDTAGNERWNYWFGPHPDLPDRAKAIIQGPNGYLYILGFCFLDNNDQRMVAISLDTLGNERWIRYLNLQTDPVDIVYGMDDNLYIAGNGHFGFGDDVLFMCIDTSGNEVWRDTFQDPGDDIGRSFFLKDNAIYLSGCETGSSGPWDDFFALCINTPMMIGEEHELKSREKMDIVITSIQRREIAFTVRCDKPVRLLINIIDILGQEIAELQKDVPEGNHSYHKSMSGCPGGVYFLKISDIDSKASVNKKFILIK